MVQTISPHARQLGALGSRVNAHMPVSPMRIGVTHECSGTHQTGSSVLRSLGGLSLQQQSQKGSALEAGRDSICDSCCPIDPDNRASARMGKRVGTLTGPVLQYRVRGVRQ